MQQTTQAAKQMHPSAQTALQAQTTAKQVTAVEPVNQANEEGAPVLPAFAATKDATDADNKKGKGQKRKQN